MLCFSCQNVASHKKRSKGVRTLDRLPVRRDHRLRRLQHREESLRQIDSLERVHNCKVTVCYDVIVVMML